MSRIHRRILGVKDVRCHPSPECPLQSSCARFKSPLPQGIGVKMDNFRGFVAGAWGQHLCGMFLSDMVQDDEDEKPKTIHPPLGAHRA